VAHRARPLYRVRLPGYREAITGADNPDLYLLTSAFDAPQAEYERWIQDVTTQLPGLATRVKFWFDPATGGKKYKDELGIRIYGQDQMSAGDAAVVDPLGCDLPVEVKPYTDPFAVFNPQLDQAPIKDILTLNPAYMDEFHNGQEDLASLYSDISIEEQNAREKVFFRMWYEPMYVDKIVRANPREAYEFPAVMQEFTYMFVDMHNLVGNPATANPAPAIWPSPSATGRVELPMPVMRHCLAA